ncbi:MAG: phosphoribosylformylglycinamidine synthase subunit PurQ [Chloroflexi bacterium]|nr:phosphoribosylformylglycinamidine synthase subunit PurQ [Chloroflexota bacterium]MCL5107653.1 phosphoribosylformylglycinamidine synthase subunit PurQ [Chloroflexota bacterium]
MKFGVVVFPGTNCDLDCHHVLGTVFGQAVDYVWHRQTDLSAYDCLVIAGGFSYGDFLRAGAIARFSPVMRSVERFAADGGLVMGICNGFQVLTEAGLLPGALMPNDCLQFRCQWVNVRVDNARTPFTSACQQGEVLRIPINHYEGRYFADEEQLADMEANDQVVLRYCAADGSLTADSNPNGSLRHIAGVCNREGNVFGLMPHPERASEEVLGSTDGARIFASLLHSLERRGRAALAGGER